MADVVIDFELVIDTIREIIFRMWDDVKGLTVNTDALETIVKEQVRFGEHEPEPYKVAIHVIPLTEQPFEITDCERWEINPQVQINWYFKDPKRERAYRGIMRMGLIIRRIFMKNKTLELDGKVHTVRILFPSPILYNLVPQAFQGVRVNYAAGRMVIALEACETLDREGA